jgi:hypothetical protein
MVSSSLQHANGDDRTPLMITVKIGVGKQFAARVVITIREGVRARGGQKEDLLAG